MDNITLPADLTSSAPKETALTAEQQHVVDELIKSVDLNDTASVMQFGAGAQQKVAEFSDSALSNVRVKDMGECGEMITDLVLQLKNFDVEDERGFLGLFKRTTNKIDALKSKYDKTEVSIERIVTVLESHQVQLLKDVAVLDKLYEINLANFLELSLYIIAGRKRLEEARNTTLAELVAKAKQTGLAEDAQAANDFSALCDRFEKKVFDLDLTRTISMQMGPQIRLVQNNDTIMAEKIQSTIVNTIPLWKSQMVIALGLAHSEEALKAQREVTDMTNQMLKKNADMLKTGTVETAREAERGIVDTETLTYTNTQLISTLDEVLKIQDEGRERRRNAEIELSRIEEELKSKLLQLKGN